MNSGKPTERYLRIAPVLYRIAFSVLRNAQDAEDAVQDTYLRALAEAGRLNLMRNAEAYLATVVRHVSLNMLRQRRDITGPVEEVELPAPGGAADALEARDELQALLGSLPEHQRRVLLLRHVGEYSFADIAALTGQTETAVRMQISRSRRQLRDLCAARSATGQHSEHP